MGLLRTLVHALRAHTTAPQPLPDAQRLELLLIENRHLRDELEKARTADPTASVNFVRNLMKCVRLDGASVLGALDPLSMQHKQSVLDQYEGDALTDFLREVQQIRERGALRSIVTFLVREQLLYTALDATNPDEQSFGRASMNGLVLALQEVELLAAVADQTFKTAEPFEPHEPLTH